MEKQDGKPLTIQTSGLRFAALEWGRADAPVVLALHGWLDNAASFSRLAPLLQDYRVIAVDLAGHGLSDHRGVGADYPIWSYVSDIVMIMDTLKLEQVHLLGHSMGATASTLFAVTMPERVLSLALIDGLWPIPGESDKLISQLKRAVEHRSRASGRAKNVFPSINIAIRARCMGFGKIGHEAAEMIVRRGLKKEDGGWVWCSDSRLLAPACLRLTQEQVNSVVAAIKVPAFLVVASRGMIASLIEKNKIRLPHINIEILEGEHHLHMEEGAEPAAKLIQAHLDAVFPL